MRSTSCACLARIRVCFSSLGDFMLLPPFAKHVVGRLVSGSVFLTAAGLCSTTFAAPTVSAPTSTQTVDENLALNNATRTQLSFSTPVQLVPSATAESASKFKIRLSVSHGAVYLSTTTGLSAAGGSLFNTTTNDPVGLRSITGPSVASTPSLSKARWMTSMLH